MKKQLLTLIGLGLLATGSAFAQGNGIKADVPFNFVANGKTHQAGPYVLKQAGISRTMVAITGPDSTTYSMTQLENSNSASGETKLVFHRYGDRYFLAQIWADGTVRELPASPREKELAMSTPERTIVLAAELR